ncbi:MucBP domain-containing protein, partial [Lacticaseibacillus hulanensis]|uniref:MucBP domain-containing protein n=1 Tax=Lacticaseibacillus hulanensis TaxID=2493111 RepID=UPI0013E35ED9
MQRNHETKLHYKMYKDGKKWVYAGIFAVALSGAAISASVLAPIAPAQAETKTETKTEVNVSYPWAGDGTAVKKAIASGNFVDATPDNKLSTVSLNAEQIKNVVAAHLKLTLDGTKWYISPGPGYTKADLNAVLKGSGFPSDAVLANPTDAANEKTILDYIGKSAMFTMNGGNTGSNGNNMADSIVSASSYSFVTAGGEATSTAALIPGTNYANVIAGSLITNSGSKSQKFLLTNGGIIEGTQPTIQWGITDNLANYDFTDDSLSGQLTKLKQAVQKINAEYDADAGNKVVFDQYNKNQIPLDFATAKQVNGRYVFTVNTDDYVDTKACMFEVKNADKYAGGDIVINLVGKSAFNMKDAGAIQGLPAKLSGNVIMANSTGNSLDLTDEEVLMSEAAEAAGGHFIVLAPLSISTGNSAAFHGFIGEYNTGTGSTATPPDPTGNGITTVVTPPDGKPKTTTTKKTFKITQNATYSYAKKAEGTESTTPEDPAKLPANTSKTITVTYDETTDDKGNVVSRDNIVFDGGEPFQAIKPAEIDGFTAEITAANGNSALDESAIQAKLNDLAYTAEDTTYNVAVVYYPNSTSVHKTMTFYNYVNYDYAEDTDGPKLPSDTTNKIKVNYIQITDTSNHVKRTNFEVDGDVPQVSVPKIAGYTTEESGQLTAESIVAMLEATNGETTFADTDVIYTPVAQTLNVHYVDGNRTELVPTKTVTGDTGESFTENAPAITGYTPDKTEQTGTFDNDTDTAQDITFVYNADDQKLNVKYVDENGKEIAPSTSTTGKTGAAYTVNAKAIDGYTPIGQTTATGIFDNDDGQDQTVTFTYGKIGQVPDEDEGKVVRVVAKQNVNIHYVDLEGNEIQTATKQTGDTGETVTLTPPALKGYVTVSQPAQFTYDKDDTVDQDVTFTYSQIGQVPDEDEGKVVRVVAKQNVNIHYVDLEGNEIQKPTVQTGDTDETVTLTPPALKGYVTVSQPTQFTYDKDDTVDQDVTFTYSQIGQVPDEDEGKIVRVVAKQNVNIHYVDLEGNEIQKPTVQTGDTDETVTLTPPALKGYVTVSQPAQFTYDKDDTVDQDVTFTYSQIGQVPDEDEGKVVRVVAKQNVNIHYVDLEGNEIQKSTVQTGDTDETVTLTPPAIKGYVTVSQPTQFTYDKDDTVDQDVTFTYSQIGQVPDEDEGKVVRVVAKQNVNIHYVDLEGNEIQKPTVQTGDTDETVTLTPPALKGYVTVSQPTQFTYDKDDTVDQDVTFKYSQIGQVPDEDEGKIVRTGVAVGDPLSVNADQNVTIHYVDEAGKQVKADTTDTGMPGTKKTYTPATVAGYYTISVPTELTFDSDDEKTQEITFVYRQEGQVPDDGVAAYFKAEVPDDTPSTTTDPVNPGQVPDGGVAAYFKEEVPDDAPSTTGDPVNPGQV